MSEDVPETADITDDDDLSWADNYNPEQVHDFVALLRQRNFMLITRSDHPAHSKPLWDVEEQMKKHCVSKTVGLLARSEATNEPPKMMALIRALNKQAKESKEDKWSEQIRRVNKFDYETAKLLDYVVGKEGNEDQVWSGSTLLCSLTKANPLRKLCLMLVTSPWFDYCVLFIIVVNSCLLALDNPLYNTPQEERILKTAEYVFTGLFTVEMCIKITAFGFVANGKISYLRDAWNVLDFVIVLSGYVFLLPGTHTNYSSFRALRIVRPLRTISNFSGMRMLVTSMITSLANMGDTFMLVMFVMFLYGVVGMQFFGGALRQRCFLDGTAILAPDRKALCRMDARPGTSDPYACAAGQFCGRGSNPSGGVIGFDNILQAWVTIIACVSAEGWVDVMYMAFESVSYFAVLYFVLLIVLVTLFLLELVTGVVYATYTKCQAADDIINFSPEFSFDYFQNRQRTAREAARSESRSKEGLELQNLREGTGAGAEDDHSPSTTERNLRVTSRRSPRTSKPRPSTNSKIPLKDDTPGSPPPPPSPPAPDARRSSRSSRIGSTLADMESLHLPRPRAVTDKRNSFVPTAMLGGPTNSAGVDTVATLQRRFSFAEREHRADALEGAVEKHIMSDGLAQYLEEGEVGGAKTARKALREIQRIRTKQQELTDLSRREARAKHSHPAVRTLFKIVNATWFRLVILVLILMNTALLASEHHGQDPSWTFTLEISNVVFTLLFTAEVVAKLIGFGWELFSSEGFNMFDLFVVILSVIELIMSIFFNSLPGLSAFRAFRLMRVFKIIRSWPQLRAIVDTMGRSMASVASFVLLLVVFIFVFALLGVQLFAGKLEGRSHMDTLGWALVVVFQVISAENWNEILYDAAEHAGYTAYLYFIPLFLIGQYLVLSLFLAILLSNFEDGDDEDKQDIFLEDASDDQHEERSQLLPLHARGASSSVVVQSDADREAELVADATRLGLGGRSLFCLGPTHPLRMMLARFYTSHIFEGCVYFLIALSTGALALDEPGLDPQSTLGQVLRYADLTINILFITEMLLKMIGYGLIWHPKAYLRNRWNLLDFVVVALSFPSFFFSGTSFVKSFRALRCLRPLRMVRRSESLMVVVTSIMKVFPAIVNVLMIHFLVIIVFGILGVNLFSGRFYWCEHSSGAVLSKGMAACTGAGELWKNPALGNFDNILWASLTLFEVSSMEMWPSVLYRAADIGPIGAGPVHEASMESSLFFIAFIVVSNFLVSNLFVGVVVDRFTSIKEEASGFSNLTDEQVMWLETHQLLLTTDAEEDLQPPKKIWRQSVFKLIQNAWFDHVINFCIGLNILTMAAWYYGLSGDLLQLYMIVNTIFSMVFFLELILKLIGLGSQYFESSWNCFDFFIVFGSVVALILTTAGALEVGGFDPTILRVFRTLRILRMAKRAGAIKKLLRTTWLALPALANAGTLLLLLLFVYAVAGMSLFGGLPKRTFLTEHANFDNIGLALLTLFRMATGESWNGIMHDCMVQPIEWCDPSQPAPPSSIKTGPDRCGSHVAIPYFVSFVVLAQMMMLNIFVAIVIEEFESVDEREATSLFKKGVQFDDMKEYATLWRQLSPPRKWYQLFSKPPQFLEWSQFELLLANLHGGFNIGYKLNSGFGVLRELKLPVRYRVVNGRAGYFVHYVEGILALSQATLKQIILSTTAEFEGANSKGTVIRIDMSTISYNILVRKILHKWKAVSPDLGQLPDHATSWAQVDPSDGDLGVEDLTTVVACHRIQHWFRQRRGERAKQQQARSTSTAV